jgi:hypothetical protein
MFRRPLHIPCCSDKHHEARPCHEECGPPIHCQNGCSALGIDVYSTSDNILIVENTNLHTAASLHDWQVAALLNHDAVRTANGLQFHDITCSSHAWSEILHAVVVFRHAQILILTDCSVESMSGVVDWSGAFAVLVKECKTLRELHLSYCYFPFDNCDEVIRAIATNTTLTRVAIRGIQQAYDIRALGLCVSANRTLRRLEVPFSVVRPSVRQLFDAHEDNWVLVELSGSDTYSRSDTAHWIVNRNRDIAWPCLHQGVLEYVIALLSLGLSPYELLWVIDWLPPMHLRFRWAGDSAHDPRHVQKIRLIERLSGSYRRVLEARQN